MKPFQFNMDQKVAIAASGETGLVIGRCEYKTGDNTYLLRYTAADGRAVQQWWDEDALTAA